MEIVCANAVYSIAGRDKGGLFIVVGLEPGYAYIADGTKHRVEKPKKKNLKHLNRTNFVSKELLEHIDAGTLENYMIRKVLAELKPN